MRHAEKPWGQVPKGGVKEGSEGAAGVGVCVGVVEHATRRWVKRKMGEKGATVRVT